ncbi:L-serine ammonia-lyase, iron-sulfur-dependent subunit beta [Levilactobacillus acidifarinae]|uniref:L-serine dehydratase n=1 Tax=Levilactobacillus acidifarinae DSM 19394 = JCM 15949 TaxID=1423715 RepID=A0A0R1LPG6_9LACO|nr:L-serine ammonia-lyase, iron-sulfur-dependent subunit beta [Levilactobacillus acidifarinae]KRK94106.1 L-serine ammonia-lyase beta subunit [Levilactobacillus acidifarinae DSM 19394]GEO69726.1 L-serine dehydratase, iron-sulfur-dependent subunit beta [Levilactobacillus acidifarinae]
MTVNYKSVFDIIGPIMIGPSSSHTAGACAIGRAANSIFQETPTDIVVHYYESFAQTHKGHGTDYAIISGILGFEPDDSRVPYAIGLARDQGINITFIEEPEDSPINHPNTAIIELSNSKDGKEVTIAGCSIGGGTIEIRGIKMNGFDIKPKGPLPILLVPGSEVDQQNVTDQLSALTKVNEKKQYQSAKGDLFEYDLDRRLKPEEVKELAKNNTNLVYL